MNVVFWDIDLNAQVPLANVSTIQYAPTGYGTQTPALSYSPTLTTNTWTVATVSTTVTVTCWSSNKCYDLASSTFNIVIRAHRTSLSATGGMISPYGNNTPVTVVFWDLDNSVQVNINNVTPSGVSFNAGALGTQTFTTYSPTLVTSTSAWTVGPHSITLTVTCVQTNRFYDAASYTFSVTIRSLRLYVYNEPTDLVYPSGDDFVIVIRVNISEPGNQFNGKPISNLTATEFTVFNSTYTFPKTITALGNGRYNLTISHTYLNMNAYTITVLISPTSSKFASASLVISFSYRPARSYLSSANYPHVTTPFGIDVTVTLNYTDVDRNKGITTASITSQGISIYGIQNLGSGIYRLTLNVTGLAKGDRQFNLTASAPQYETKKLTFTLTIRIAYTSAIPTVGSLDIPVGNSPVFYVRFWDTDRDQVITGASMTTSWIRGLTATYVPAEQRYSVQFVTLDTDVLRSNYVVTFNFSKGGNYQLGIFNITITIRTHNTDFRLVSAVQPTSYNGIVNISLYYGDLDNNAGIDSAFVSCKVRNATELLSSITLVNSGSGFYIVRFPASQFGGLGLQTLTIYFNWTGSVYKFYNKTLVTGVNIVGEDSKYTLLQASEPTPYLANMSYTFLYAELYSGIGITNSSGNVHIRVLFQGESVDLSKVKIWETNRGTSPGYYSIRFNTTLFIHTGLIYMNVYINWSKGVTPFYTNRTDVISVRLLARDTLVSVIPPSPTAWGENATFSFTFDDVTGGGSNPIAYGGKMTITLSLSSYTLSYNSTTKLFTISFRTSQSPIGDAPLGSKSFTLSVTWAGTPYYANRTGRSIAVTVIARQTVLDYQTPAPTPYLDNVTFVVTWTDVTSSPVGITGATVTLYSGAIPVSTTNYTVTPLGGGSYSIQLNTTYKSSPGTYSLRITLTRPEFYIPGADSSRQFSIQYRVTLLSSEPIDKVPYNSSVQIKVHYQDLLRLTTIGNGSSLTSIRILNGTSWLFTCSWQPAFDYYLLTVYTYNHPELRNGRLYTLRLNMTYANQVPFYFWDDTYITFQLRPRETSLTASSPPSTPYLDYANFTVTYQDVDAGKGIGSATIKIKNGSTFLVLNVHYRAVETSPGVWAISVNSTALGGIRTAQVVVNITWYGTPYYVNKTQNVDIPVIRRPTSVDIVVSPSLTRYLDNIVFTIAFSDNGRRYYISGISDKILIQNGTKYLTSGQYSVVAGSVPGTFDIRINSTVLSVRLLTDYQISVKAYWPNATPYYANGTIIVRITTTNRVGSVTWIPIDNTPMGDLMNLTFYYRDLDTGTGIANAIIQFDCVEKPGLQVGVDYSLVKGTGADTGRYIVRVNTNRLLGIRTYTFTLTVLWNAATSPYYANQTSRSINGVVRTILASLTPGTATPSPVPYYDIVSINVTFDDVDHVRPITGVTKSNVTVLYGTGIAPKAWGFSDLGGGKYRITVNVSDSGLPDVKTLKITFNWYPYTVLEQTVPFSVRYRNGLLTRAGTSPNLYAGDPGYVVLNLTDTDSGKHMPGATLAITWGASKSSQDIGNGLYNVSFSTAGMDAGSHTMYVQASKGNYTILLLAVDIFLKAVPMNVVVPDVLKGKSVYWGDTIVIYVFVNDTQHDLPVTGAAVTYIFQGHPGSLTPISPAGNYSTTLDTSLVGWGTAIVQIRAEKSNYLIAEAQLALNVERLPTTLTSGIYSTVLPRGQPWLITVYLNDTYNGVPVTDAAVLISWYFVAPRQGYMTALGDGHYQYNLPTGESERGKSYVISISATRTNYQSALTSLQLQVTEVLTRTNPDSVTATYVNRTFYWSEIVTIGVWVTANLSQIDPDYYRTGMTVTWTSPGGLGGTFTSHLDGHYTYDLNTSTLSAVSYTLWIVSSSDDPYFSASGTVITIVIQKIPTSVAAPSSTDRFWGWKGTFVFNYTISNTTIGIDNVSYGHVLNAHCSWAGTTQNAVYQGNGRYAIYVDTTLVPPGPQPNLIVLWFDYDNYVPASGAFNLIVKYIPTDIGVYYQNAVYNSGTHTYQLAYGDDLRLWLYFNATVTLLDTPFAGGIEGANWSLPYGHAWLFTGYSSTIDLTLMALPSGNYSLIFHSTDFKIQEGTYHLDIKLHLANRIDGVIDIYVKVIEITTVFTIEEAGGYNITMHYGDTISLTVRYSDSWHGGLAISGASITARAGSSALVVSNSSLGDGRYRLTIFADPGFIPVNLQPARLYIDVVLSKEYYASVVFTVTVNAVPTSFQDTLRTAVTIAFPAVFVLMSVLVLWARVFSVPKRLRQINGMIKSLRKGKIPKPITAVKSRQELVADLFNDTFTSMSLTRTWEQMPAETIAIAIPEMGELLIQLTMLTHLNQQELDDFKADISKMKMSEQAAFVKEVITQEATRVARREGKTLDQVMADLKAQSQRRVGEAEGVKAGPIAPEEAIEERIILRPEKPPRAPVPPVEEVRKAPPTAGAEEIVTGEKLSQFELEELKKQLEQRGVPAHEIDTIMEQAKKLPRYLIDELVRSLTRGK